MNKILKIGTRSSKLALTQTGNSLKKLTKIFSTFAFKTVPFSSPGDRDRKTDLKISDADFFTRDLDEALIQGEIDAAVHSAKDLPDEINPELDYFWLPWHEDPRDVLVEGKNIKIKQPIKEEKHNINDQITKSQNYKIKKLKIGVSSERREKYCFQRFPEAELLPVRGNIEERISQLDEGKYDLLIMAAAGLKRLGLEDRISEYISLIEMPSPAGQGYLAVTFRRGDQRFEIMRSLFVKPVLFAGSGPGDPDLATLACVNALKHCDICLYDSLAPEELLQYLSQKAQAVYVGKRSGKHSRKQREICKLITKFARQGKSVVRLKGGDAGIFGRLAEEVEALDEFSLPYKVIPGISSLQSASASTGLLLTRRGVSRGFSVMTPRKGSSAKYQAVKPQEHLQFPRTYFMGKSVIAQTTADLIEEGWNKNESAALIFSAGTDNEFILTGTIANIAKKAMGVNVKDNDQPGLLIVGPNADKKFLYHQNGAMSQKKVLITCSETLQQKAICEVRKFCGIPISMPMIKTSVPQPSPLASQLCSVAVLGCTSSDLQPSPLAAPSDTPTQTPFIHFDYANPLKTSERSLPHWNQSGVTYFITFRLADSIPQITINKIKKERNLWIQRYLRKTELSKQPSPVASPLCSAAVPGCTSSASNNENLPLHNIAAFSFSSLSDIEKKEYYLLFSKRIQNLLDVGSGSCCLRNPEIGKIVADSLMHSDGIKYNLGEWVVMPNHVHVLVTPLKNTALSDILHDWKSFTARNINKILNRKGKLWQGESYDHIVRNKTQLAAIESYIRANPEKAKVKNCFASFDRSQCAAGDGRTTEEVRCAAENGHTTEEVNVQPGTATLQRKSDWYLFTSPASVKIFICEFRKYDLDLRQLPKIIVCGPGTACEFRKIGIIPDLIAEDDFGAAGLLKIAKKYLNPKSRILRFCSDKADEKLTCELRKLGFIVENQIFYNNTPQQYANLPDFDAAIFASSSAVNAFIENFGIKSFKNKIISVIGQPTLKTFKQKKVSNCKLIIAREASIPETVNALAEYYVKEKLELKRKK